MLSGLEASTGDLVVVMDADLQDPPSLLPEMLMAMEEGFDSCAAFRASRRGEPPLRSFFARGFYRLMNSMSAIELKQGARDYRMMTRQVVEAVLALTETERFSKGLFQWVGFSTKWIGYQNVQRTVGRTKWSFSSLLKYAVGGIVAFSTVPLRIAALLGLAVDAAAVAYMLYVFIRVMAFGTASSGFATTIIIMLFLGGTTITILGIIGEYIARIYSEVKRRPAYLLKETNIEAMRGVLRSDAAS
jgi:glycosyltransferase involved in cell wall biosynthesis